MNSDVPLRKIFLAAIGEEVSREWKWGGNGSREIRSKQLQNQARDAPESLGWGGGDKEGHGKVTEKDSRCSD